MEIKSIIQAYKIKFIAIFVIIYGILWAISKIKNPFQSINPQMDLVVFIIIPQLLSLLLYSLILSLIIGASYLCLKNKLSVKALSYLKYFFGNFILILPIIAINFGLFYIITKQQILQNYIANAILYSIVTLLIANIFILSFFFHSLKGQSIIKSVKNSFACSIKNYPFLLVIEIIFFIISIPISYIPFAIIKDTINFLVIYPIFSLILTGFFEDVSAK